MRMQMKEENTITVQNISKKFFLYEKPSHRVLELLSINGKSYKTEFDALDDVSFEIKKGEVFGILGKNGSGKSTLLQIICSVLSPSSGNVTVNGKIAALLELGAGFDPELSGRKNSENYCQLQGLSGQDLESYITLIEEFADIGEFFEFPMRTYSSGMYVRVAFAAAINVDPDVLIIDEALSVGDSKFQHKCFQKLLEFVDVGKTIVFVSHSTDTMLRLCDRGIVLSGGKVALVGTIQDCVNTYQELLFGQSETQEKLVTSPQIQTELSNSFEHHSVESHPLYNVNETRIGRREVEIVNCELTVNGKPYRNELVQDFSNIEISFQLKFNIAKSNIAVGFAFITLEGLYAFGTNLKMMNAPLISGLKNDLKTVHFKFQSNLISREYFVNLGCDEFKFGDQLLQDTRRSVLNVKFGNDYSKTGMVNLDVKFSSSND